MSVPTDGAPAWTPRPLPEDDVLAREPDPDEVAALVAPADAPADDAPADAPADDAPAPSDAAPDTAAAELSEEEALAVALPLLQSATATPGNDRRRWSGSLVGIVVVLFFLFAPVQLLLGNALLWFATYVVGGTLAIAGGIVMGPAVLSRGRAPAAALVCFGAGAVLILICVVSSAIGAARIAA